MRLPPLLLALLGGAVVGLLAGPAAAREEKALRVFAAASLTEVVQKLAARFEGPVVPSFGASSVLARQIRDGAPADLFLSASPDWIAFLREADRLAGEPVVLARNRLVAIAPEAGARGSLAMAETATPEALLAGLAQGDRVAIADVGVPAGEYARAALSRLGLLDAFRPHLLGRKDVRAVLHTVERGEAPAGFVYATDARGLGVRVLFVFDREAHSPIAYQAAAIRDAAQPAGARRFLDFLRGPTARALLAEAGFELP